MMALVGMFVVFTLIMRQSSFAPMASAYERSEHALWFFFVLPQFLTLINYVFLAPQFCAMCQTAYNEVAESQQKQLAALLGIR